jgi:3,4-dihydroxyphenylacetate 2,3-dioxygenase
VHQISTEWLEPPFDIVRCAHAELVVADLDRSQAFYCDLLGFVLTERTDDALYLRGFEERVHHSLVLRRGPAPALGHLAYRVRTPADLDAAERYYAELGCETRRVDGAEAGLASALRVQDALGFVLELFHETAHADNLLQRYDLYRGANIARLDHFNVLLPSAPKAYEAYRQLGFRCSEYIADEREVYAAWMYRKSTVHDIAFTTGDGPRLHHLGFAVVDSSHVIRTCDILAGAHEEGAIERGPGRHGVSNAFYLYMRDPDGHRIELYTGDYYTGDPDHEPIRWDATDDRRRSYWAHAVPDSWYLEGTRVLTLAGEIAPLEPAEVDERIPVAG